MRLKLKIDTCPRTLCLGVCITRYIISIKTQVLTVVQYGGKEVESESWSSQF